MPDEISQALPEGQLEAQVQEATPQQETPTEPQTEKPITLEDVRKLMRDEFTPIIQSQVAKGENRIDKRIQERFAALEQNKGALRLTDEQVATAQQEIIREEQMNAYKPANPQTNGTAQPEIDPNGMERFVTDQIEQVFKKYGDRVTPNDAEFKIIDAAWNDPNGSLADTLLAVSEATQKMVARKALQKKNADARVLGSGGGKPTNPNDISNITDTEQLYALGEQKLRSKK